MQVRKASALADLAMFSARWLRRMQQEGGETVTVVGAVFSLVRLPRGAASGAQPLSGGGAVEEGRAEGGSAVFFNHGNVVGVSALLCTGQNGDLAHLVGLEGTHAGPWPVPLLALRVGVHSVGFGTMV